MKQGTQLLLQDNPEDPTGSPTVPRGQRGQGHSPGKGEDGRLGSDCREPRSASPLIPHPSSPTSHPHCGAPLCPHPSSPTPHPHCGGPLCLTPHPHCGGPFLPPPLMSCLQGPVCQPQKRGWGSPLDETRRDRNTYCLGDFIHLFFKYRSIFSLVLSH